MQYPVPAATAVIVHPDATVRAQVTQALPASLTVYPAQTIAEAVEQIVRHAPAVIVCDWDLPDGDGLAFMRQVRAEPALAAMVLVCVSHADSVTAKVHAFQAGADTYAVLPLDPRTFGPRITVLQRVRRYSR